MAENARVCESECVCVCVCEFGLLPVSMRFICCICLMYTGMCCISMLVDLLALNMRHTAPTTWYAHMGGRPGRRTTGRQAALPGASSLCMHHPHALFAAHCNHIFAASHMTQPATCTAPALAGDHMTQPANTTTMYV